MRAPFQFSKTTVSMQQKADYWQIWYTKDGESHVHLTWPTEAECDASMDRIKLDAELRAAALAGRDDA